MFTANAQLLFILESHDFLDTTCMAPTAEIRRQEGLKDFLICRKVNESSRKRNDICVVMLTAQSRKRRRNNIGCANAINFIRSDSHTNTSTTNQNATLGFAVYYVMRNQLSEIRVIDTIIVLRTTIDDGMTLFFQVCSKLLLLLETCVIACDANVHDYAFP